MAKSKRLKLNYIFINPNTDEGNEKIVAFIFYHETRKQLEEALLKKGIITQTQVDAGFCRVEEYENLLKDFH